MSRIGNYSYLEYQRFRLHSGPHVHSKVENHLPVYYSGTLMHVDDCFCFIKKEDDFPEHTRVRVFARAFVCV